MGEVFTEAKQLDAVSGTVWVTGFPNLQRVVEDHTRDPFAIQIEKGRIVGIDANAPPQFLEIMETIRYVLYLSQRV